MTTDAIGKAEGFGSDIARRCRVLREQLDVGLDDILQSLLTPGDDRRIVIVSVFARRGMQDRQRVLNSRMASASLPVRIKATARMP